MKKTIIVVISIILIICLALGIVYAIDMNRMKNNEPVFFSTWGYCYAPPVGDKEVINTNVLNENEVVNEKQATYSKDGDYLSLNIPNDWEFEAAPELSDIYRGGIKIYPKNSENSITVYCANWFGVCGTGLRVERVSLNNGVEMEVGYYNNNESWDYAYFEDGNIEIATLNRGLEGEEAETAIETLKTIEYKNEK